MIKIKVCGMVDPVNSGEIAKTAPDFIGFLFYPGSKRYVGNAPDESLFRNIPSGIMKTGVFVNEEPALIIEITRRYGLDLVQLHGNESAEYCNSLRKAGLTIIKAFEISDSFDFMTLNKYSEACEFFLFDAKTGSSGGSGSKFDWTKIDEFHLKKPFFLSGGIGPEDASLVKQITHKSLFAVDINSRFEIRPGIKDRDMIEAFINEIKR
jgi:phosphoribosylanthranilate isomerase